MKYRVLLIALASTGILLGGCNKKGGDDAAAAGADSSEPAATVGGEKISKQMFEFYARNRAGKASSELKPEQRQELLDQLIGLEVAAQSATKAGLEKDADTASRLTLTRMNVLAEAAVAKNVGTVRPTDQELRAEYETQIAALPALEYHARHILVATEPFAQTLIDKIKGGADFAQIARKESMDGSKENGGELTWFSPNRMVPEFAKAVTALKKDEMTQKPVKTEFGYHIIQLLDTRPVSPPEFDTVKDRLGGMVQQKKVQAYIDGLKKTAKIEKKI